MENTNEQGDVPYYNSASSSIDAEELNDTLLKLDNSTLIIPDSVVSHFMAKAGCSVTDPNVIKLLSLSTQKLMTSILSDAQAHHQFGASATDAATLTNQDAAYALRAKGAMSKKPPYFVDTEEE